MIPFTKAHGTGNDFVVVSDFDNKLEVSATAAQRICDRRFGVGADGLIRIGRDDDGSYFMDYRNADGSVAEMCGNGVRVVGKWLGDRGYVGDEFDLATRAGIKHLSMNRDALNAIDGVRVDMGAPIGPVLNETIDVLGTSYEITIVSMGNPHAVLFVDDVDAVDVAELGPALETHHRFPHHTNVEFVDEREGLLRQRTWERGVGETLACGTGACAVLVAALHSGVISGPAEIELRGGRLSLSLDRFGSVIMVGAAVEVFEGELDPSLFA